MLDPSTAPGGEFGCAQVTRLLARARAAAAAAALAAGRGAARARPPVLGRGGRDRPRLPRARDGARLARHRRAARRPGGADHVAPARPRAAAVGALRDRGPRVRARARADQDPPRGHRRAVSGAEIMALLLDLTPEGREVRRRPTTDLADPRADRRCRCSGSGCSALPRYPVRMLRGAAEGDPEPRGHAVRRSSRASGTLSRVAGDAAAATAYQRPGPDGAQDDLQRAHLAAPALRLRPAVARRVQGGQEQARGDRQRRRRQRLRGRGAALADRARRPAGRRRWSRRCRCRCAPASSSAPTATGSC